MFWWFTNYVGAKMANYTINTKICTGRQPRSKVFGKCCQPSFSIK